MKTNLLKNFTMLVAFFATITLTAQQGPTLYDFVGGAQSWVKGYGAGTVGHDPTEGVSGDGALTLDRLQTNNNANIRRGQGGDPAFVVIDRAVYNFLKITYKNETAADHFRVQGQSRPVGGVAANFPNIVVNGITSTSSSYSVIYVDLATIPAGHEVTRLDILVRANATSDPVGSLVYFDEIELLTSIPTEFSEFIKNPNFEDASGIGHITGNTSDFNRALSSEAQDGLNSYSMTFTTDTAKNNWNFGNASAEIPVTPLAGAALVTVKMWVKTTRTGATAPFRIAQRTRTRLAGAPVYSTGTEFPSAEVLTTSTDGSWEELTFEYTVPSPFDEGTFWFGILYDAGSPDEGMKNGDVVYFDNMTATIAPSLGTDKNTLEGVNVYPNPASDVLNISTKEGADIAIYNILGAKVTSAKTALQNYSMNISNLKSGIYMVKLTSKGQTYTKKLAIK